MNFRQIKAIEAKNKSKILDLNPKVAEVPGIYILIREDNGIKYAYVGQAKNLLSRLAQHLSGYQHIDLSIKKHGLYSDDNPTGYNIVVLEYEFDRLDEREQYWIKRMAEEGYQLRNHTMGGQGKGKTGIDWHESRKTYTEGIKRGEKKTREYVSGLFKRYLTFDVIQPMNKNKQKAYNKFKEFIDIEEENPDEQKEL